MTLAEMYVQGVSTRKVSAITERLCGTQVSASQVSRAAKQLDEELEMWRNRPLGEIVYLYLDARYEKVRQAGNVRDAAILIASGVNGLFWAFPYLSAKQKSTGKCSGRVGQARGAWGAADHQ